MGCLVICGTGATSLGRTWTTGGLAGISFGWTGGVTCNCLFMGTAGGFAVPLALGIGRRSTFGATGAVPNLAGGTVSAGFNGATVAPPFGGVTATPGFNGTTVAPSFGGVPASPGFGVGAGTGCTPAAGLAAPAAGGAAGFGGAVSVGSLGWLTTFC